jgi:hypothetical protein
MTKEDIVMCTLVRVTKLRFLIRMIEFISTLFTHCLLITLILVYRPYSAIADLHPFQLTVHHALGFSLSTSRLLTTNLNRETITSNH